VHARRLRVLVAALGVVLLGCGDDGSGSATTATPGTTADDDDGPPADASGDPTGSPGSSGSASEDDGSSGPPSTDDGGEAPPCASNDDCAAAELCVFADHSCGVSGRSGACAPRPSECTEEDRPICGCDGDLHASQCSAASAGVDVDFLGECELPGGAFACGFSFCIHGDEYCLEQGGAMPSFQCLALPPVCQPPDCSCITTCCGCDNASCCSDYCINEDDALTYTCPG
jgi:hypothetical protein